MVFELFLPAKRLLNKRQSAKIHANPAVIHVTDIPPRLLHSLHTLTNKHIRQQWQ